MEAVFLHDAFILGRVSHPDTMTPELWGRQVDDSSAVECTNYKENMVLLVLASKDIYRYIYLYIFQKYWDA